MNWGMKMTDERKPDEGLEALFDLARADAAAPSDALLSAIMSDAVAVQAERAAPVTPEKQRSGWRKLLAALGGWPSVTGLAAATLTGIWIGVSPPEAIDTLTASLIGSELSDSDVLYGFDILLAEG